MNYYANDLFDDEILALARGFQQLTSLVMPMVAIEASTSRTIQLHHLETLDLFYCICTLTLCEISQTCPKYQG